MAKSTILVGSSADDGTGDSLRNGGIKINDNFTEIYNALGDGSNIVNIASNSYVNTTFETKAVALAANTAMKNLVDDRLQVANASIIYQTKAIALTTNNAVVNLVNDRLQVANAVSLINDRLQVANANILYETKAVALAANNTQNNLINDRLQVANADVLYQTKAVALSTNTTIVTLINNETKTRLQVANAEVLYVTKATALSSNNSLINLINDRMQVANAKSIGISSATWTDANDTITFTRPDGTSPDELDIKITGFGGAGATQNVFATISSDSGSTEANISKDTLTISGNNGIITSISGDTLEIHQINEYPSIARLDVTANGAAGYLFDSHYPSSLGNNPTIYAISGTTLAFDLSQITSSHPFLIQDSGGTNYSNNLIHVSAAGVETTGTNAQAKYGGVLYWQIPYNVTGNFAYKCQNHAGMNGTITIKDIATI